MTNNNKIKRILERMSKYIYIYIIVSLIIFPLPLLFVMSQLLVILIY